jgi:hypothetical protein
LVVAKLGRVRAARTLSISSPANAGADEDGAERTVRLWARLFLNPPVAGKKESERSAEQSMSKESEQAFTPEDFQKRFDAAAQAAQREYCDIFAFWRACRLKACRRSKACGGDPQLCLKRGYAQVPDELSDRALARVIGATAADADRPTKLARQMSPQSFYLWPQRT